MRTNFFPVAAATKRFLSVAAVALSTVGLLSSCEKEAAAPAVPVAATTHHDAVIISSTALSVMAGRTATFHWNANDPSINFSSIAGQATIELWLSGVRKFTCPLTVIGKPGAPGFPFGGFPAGHVYCELAIPAFMPAATYDVIINGGNSPLALGTPNETVGNGTLTVTANPKANSVYGFLSQQPVGAKYLNSYTIQWWGPNYVNNMPLRVIYRNTTTGVYYSLSAAEGFLPPSGTGPSYGPGAQPLSPEFVNSSSGWNTGVINHSGLIPNGNYDIIFDAFDYSARYLIGDNINVMP